MTLKTSDTFHGLAICKTCGWPIAGQLEYTVHVRCRLKAAGESAVALAALVPELPSTKYGYGARGLVVTIDDQLHVRFECADNGTFDLRDVWLLGNLTKDAAAALVKAIAAWRQTSKPSSADGGAATTVGKVVPDHLHWLRFARGYAEELGDETREQTLAALDAAITVFERKSERPLCHDQREQAIFGAQIVWSFRNCASISGNTYDRGVMREAIDRATRLVTLFKEVGPRIDALLHPEPKAGDDK